MRRPASDGDAGRENTRRHVAVVGEDQLRALAPLLAKPDGPILLDCKINAAVAAPFLLESIEYEKRKA